MAKGGTVFHLLESCASTNAHLISEAAWPQGEKINSVKSPAPVTSEVHRPVYTHFCLADRFSVPQHLSSQQ